MDKKLKKASLSEVIISAICLCGQLWVLTASSGADSFIRFLATILAVSSAVSSLSAGCAAFSASRRYSGCPGYIQTVAFVSAAAGAVAVILFLIPTENCTLSALFTGISAAVSLICGILYGVNKLKAPESATLAAVMFLAPVILCGFAGACGNYIKTQTAAVTVTAASETASPETSGSEFGDFVTLTFDGEVFTFSEELSQNKVNVINIWATFCGPCIREMPDLDSIADEYSGTVGVFGICADTSDENGDTDFGMLDKAIGIADGDLSVNYPMLIPSAEMQRGFMTDIFAYPTTYITDSSGNILQSFYGTRTREQFIRIISQYL